MTHMGVSLYIHQYIYTYTLFRPFPSLAFPPLSPPPSSVPFTCDAWCGSPVSMCTPSSLLLYRVCSDRKAFLCSRHTSHRNRPCEARRCSFSAGRDLPRHLSEPEGGGSEDETWHGEIQQQPPRKARHPGYKPCFDCHTEPSPSLHLNVHVPAVLAVVCGECGECGL
jgi:hypothetical protein